MPVATQLPTLITIVVTAAIDSINPCAIGVLILMISVMLAGGHSTRKMLMYGLVYIGAVAVTYFLAGIGLLYFLANVPLIVTEYISIAVGLLIIVAGLLFLPCARALTCDAIVRGTLQHRYCWEPSQYRVTRVQGLTPHRLPPTTYQAALYKRR